MTADELIKALDLAPHPEGGWYRETWRAEAADGERGAASAVCYVTKGQADSRWNRVDAAEMWLWHGGDPLDLRIAASDSGPVRTIRLGGHIAEGEQPQIIIPAGSWQSAAAVLGGESGYTFLSCIVAPAFDFAGYNLAAPGWAPG